jgi:hypothetical protein
VLDRAEDSGAVGAHFEVDLLGLELHQRVADRHAVARLLQPLRDARLDHRLTEFRNHNVRCHIFQQPVSVICVESAA